MAHVQNVSIEVYLRSGSIVKSTGPEFGVGLKIGFVLSGEVTSTRTFLPSDQITRTATL